MLEWADAEETVETLRRKTAEHFHGESAILFVHKSAEVMKQFIYILPVTYSPCQWPARNKERQRSWRESWRQWRWMGLCKTENPKQSQDIAMIWSPV